MRYADTTDRQSPIQPASANVSQPAPASAAGQQVHSTLSSSIQRQYHGPLPFQDVSSYIAPQDRSAPTIVAKRLSNAQQELPQMSLPTFLVQLAALLGLYTFHLTVLAQNVAVFGGYIVMGYDSLVGAMIASWYLMIYRKQQYRLQQSWNNNNDNNNEKVSFPLFPWNLPTAPVPITTNVEATSSVESSSNRSILLDIESSLRKWFQSTNWKWIRFRLSTLVTITALVKAYFSTGSFSLYWEDLLYAMSAAGWPLTIPLARSLQVLLGHLSWVAIGSAILWAIPRPPPFFASRNNNGTSGSNNNINNNNGKPIYYNGYRWFRTSLSKDWLWWTIGGYYVSSWLFNIADATNRILLPTQVLHDAAESVVAQLVQPEHNDLWASLIGYIAPCVSAPVWEELLYRGFLLAGLTASTGSWHASCLLQAVLFSAHHMSVTAALPLAVLGWTWAVLYTHSRNLWTVIAVHAMWNSRVFFGSWFGL